MIFVQGACAGPFATSRVMWHVMHAIADTRKLVLSFISPVPRQWHNGRLVLPPRFRVVLEALVRLTFQVVIDFYYSGLFYTSSALEDESDHEDIDVHESNIHINDSYMPCKLRT